MINCILKELSMRREYLGSSVIESVYLGGGTPSVLSEMDLELILEVLNKNFNLAEAYEFTLEANPDDLDRRYLDILKDKGINRLSVGIQSFFEEDLLWMNRSHSAQQAFDCIEDARQAGIDTISIDLIFGCPSSDNDAWRKNLELASSMNIDHISCYGLTVEAKTALELMIQKGKTEAPREEEYSQQFLMTMEFLESQGFDHYELSNYARSGGYAIHNTNYWKAVPYAGFGPSAHSFDGNSRQWNISHNIKYMNSLEEGAEHFEKEDLSPKDKFNEYIMTGLRTKWGCQRSRLIELDQANYDEIEHVIHEHIEKKNLQIHDNSIILTTKGKLIANTVISDLFILS